MRCLQLNAKLSDMQIKQVAQLSQRDRATPKSLEVLSAAAHLYEKSHLTRRIALSCGIKISPIGSLDFSHSCYIALC